MAEAMAALNAALEAGNQIMLALVAALGEVNG
jgi:hypothetical protein